MTSIPLSISTDSAIQLTSTVNAVVQATHVPIAGTTTTQVNVRAEPSTASESLGMINIFTKIQIAAKDVSGSWYQIVNSGLAQGSGWVRAEYVQVDATAEIPIIGSEAGQGPELSGLVSQKINVRSGPALTFDTIGVLNPNDVVLPTGKDPSGAWIQIKFAGAADGTGWASSEFLKVSDPAALPIIGKTDQGIVLPTVAPLTTPIPAARTAMADGDSMQSPLVATILSSTSARAIQISGDVSAPGGDTKDWLQFSTSGTVIVMRATCSTAALQIELWLGETLANQFGMSCGSNEIITVTSGKTYFISVSEPNASQAQYTTYTLKLEVPH